MAPAKTRKRNSGQDLPTDKTMDSASPEDSKRQRKLPVRAKDGEAPIATSTPAQGSMKVFTDEDNAKPVSVAPSKPAAPALEEEEEEDSDDEAPEAVSTSKVASDIKKSAQAAQKAAREQAAELKRKRQQRDTLLKQQAEERKKAEEEAPTIEDTVQSESPTRKRQTDKVHVPNLLPAEFLTDSSSEDEAEDDRLVSAGRPKRRKITTIQKNLARESRGPRDERVGSTVYRVAKKVDERMAPKLSKYAKSSRDLLLKRNRTAVKPQRSGFLVKK